METITGNAERSDAGTSDASGLAEATALEATNASDATATTPDAPVASASEAANAEKDPSRVGSSEPPPLVPSPLGKTAEPASPVSGATASDAARDDADRDSPRVLSPTSKWRVLRTRVRAMSFVERVGKMAAHARPSTLQARAALPNGNLMMNLPNGNRMSIPRTAADGVDTAIDTFTFTFTGALDVPDAELDRDISRVLLRACLVRGGEFVGPVAAVPGTRTSDADGVAAWRFGRESRESRESLSRPAIEPLTVAEMMASPSGSGGEGGKTEDAEDDAYHLLARADRGVAPSCELHVELNVVPAVGGDGTRGVSRDASLSSDTETETETETERSWFGAPPASFPKKPPLVSARRPDEICVAWGRVPWPDATAEKKSGKKKPAVVDVALRGFGGAGGSDAISPSGSATDDPEGVLLPASAKAKASSAGFFRKFTEKAKRLGRGPTVRVRVAAPPPPHAAAAAKLPRETLCASRFVPLLATFRELREREARAARDTQNVSSSPALTAIPACLRDEHLADALADAFRRARLKKVSRKSLAKTRETRDSETDENVEVLETLALKFWALTRTGALRDARVDAFASGDAEARRRRARVIEKSVSQHPHKSLSREPDGWCHEPFSVAELRHVFA